MDIPQQLHGPAHQPGAGDAAGEGLTREFGNGLEAGLPQILPICVLPKTPHVELAAGDLRNDILQRATQI